MKDMLVKLYDLPEVCLELEELKKTIDFRRPLAAEKYIICDWVEKNFGKGWMSETEVSFSKTPISTFVAIKNLHQFFWVIIDTQTFCQVMIEVK